MKQTCQYCKAAFEASRKDKHYCNATCRQNAYVYRKAEILAGVESTSYQNASVHQSGSKSQNVLMDENKSNDLKAFIYSTIQQALNELKPESRQNVLTANGLLENENIKTLSAKLEEDVQTVLTDHSGKTIPVKENKETTPVKEYKFRPCQFTWSVQALMNEREFDYELGNCYENNKHLKENLDWVNIRLRCLVESLLTISERSEVPLEDLREIANAFTLIIKSAHYQKLPLTYSYIQTIKTLRDKIRDLYLDNQEADTMNLKFGREFKIELLAMRCELRGYVPKKTFNQISFKEPKKQEPCETDHRPKEEGTENKYYQRAMKKGILEPFELEKLRQKY